jgi:hypothetical protein
MATGDDDANDEGDGRWDTTTTATTNDDGGGRRQQQGRW